MKINYDNFGRISEIIFDEGEDQAAFWNFMRDREKEITIRNKDIMNGQIEYVRNNNPFIAGFSQPILNE